VVFVNGYFSWGGTVLSTHVREIRLRLRKTEVPDHDTMGNTGEKFVIVLQGYDLEVIFRQDFAAAAVEQTLAADHLAGTARAWAVRKDAGTIATENPEYQGTGFLFDYDPISGAFGQVLGTRASIHPSVAGVTRDITP
jgi:hypothetical protein